MINVNSNYGDNDNSLSRSIQSQSIGENWLMRRNGATIATSLVTLALTSPVTCHASAPAASSLDGTGGPLLWRRDSAAVVIDETGQLAPPRLHNNSPGFSLIPGSSSIFEKNPQKSPTNNLTCRVSSDKTNLWSFKQRSLQNASMTSRYL